MRLCHRFGTKMLKAAFVFCVLSFCACGGRQVQQEAPPEEVPQPPLSKKYENIVLMNYEGTPEILRDYPGVVEECRASTMTALLTRDVLKKVEKFDSNKKYDDNTMLVKAKVTEMRIVSASARSWGGAMAGSSHMNLDVRLIDAATNTEVRSKQLFSANNPFGAAWAGGSSDRSLPADMGKIIAEYLFSIMP